MTKSFLRSSIAVAAIIVISLVMTEVIMRLIPMAPARHDEPKWFTYQDGEFRDLGVMGYNAREGKYYGRLPALDTWKIFLEIKNLIAFGVKSNLKIGFHLEQYSR